MERVEEEPARKMIYGRYVSINCLLYFPTKFTSMFSLYIYTNKSRISFQILISSLLNIKSYLMIIVSKIPISNVDLLASYNENVKCE